VVTPSVGAMPITTREARETVDEVAGHLEHEVRQVAWWRAVEPAEERAGEQPASGRSPEPVNAGRATTWSRWA
jgi:hypothetical protein